MGSAGGRFKTLRRAMTIGKLGLSSMSAHDVRVRTLLIDAPWVDGQVTRVAGVQAEAVVDPTGCGDAFRAGMLFGLTRGMDWMTIGRLASLMGALKIESQGGQNHAPTLEAIEQRFEKEFGYRF